MTVQTGQVHPLRFEVKNLRGGVCLYFVGISKGQSNTYYRELSNGLERLDFNIYKSSAPAEIIFDAPDITQSNQTWSGIFFPFFPPTFQLTGYLALGNTSNSSSGMYTDTFQVHLYRGQYRGGYRLMDTKILTVNYFQASSVSLSLVDSNSPFDPADVTQNLDFGQLTTGESQSFDIMVKSNDGYSLSMSASNNGKMKHATENSFVDFNTFINGSQVSLQGSANNPVVVDSETQATPPVGKRIRCEIVIGNPNNAVAGRYREAITITATAY
jgi:spore coat protein U-like protein